MSENTCGWLVQRRREITPKMIEAEWHPDSESDLWEIGECGASTREITDGWECEAGHRHYYYGSPSQRAEEMMEAMMEREAW